MPASQPVDLIPADLYVELPHGNEVRQRGHFVLCRKHHARAADGIGKAKFLNLRKALSQLKLSISIDLRVRDGLVERYFRRPLGDGIVALAAFIQPDVHRFDFIEEVSGALHEQIRQARGGTGVDQRYAVFFFEFLCVAELLGLERVPLQVRAEIGVMRAQPQRGPENNLIEHRRRSVDDELAALCGLHDSAQVSRVHFGYRDGAFLAQEAPRALRVAVSAPDRMSLPLQQLREKRAGRSGP